MKSSRLPAADAPAHERVLIEAFIVKERKQRLLQLLEGPKRRKFHDFLHHLKDLDNRFAKPLPEGTHAPARSRRFSRNAARRRRA